MYSSQLGASPPFFGLFFGRGMSSASTGLGDSSLAGSCASCLTTSYFGSSFACTDVFICIAAFISALRCSASSCLERLLC
jgi:hypothetical protein